MASTTAKTAPRWRSVALPPEHGAWGFLLEPLLLGILVAPSWAGAGLILAVIGAFLIRQPFKVATVDWRRGKRYARTKLAEQFTLFFSAMVVIGGLLALALAGWEPLIPLVLGAPLAVILLVATVQNRGRDMLPELAGAVAMALSAASIALAGDQSAERAFALWAILVARNITSILYVRARLRLEKEQPYSWWLVTVTNVLAVVSLGALALTDYAPWLAVVALIILLVRALNGLSPYRGRVKTSTIGFLEIAYGLLIVIAAALGYAIE